jgi:hypothetical protein
LACAKPRFASERSAAHQQRRQRGGERRAPRLEGQRAAERLEPARPECDVIDLLLGDDLLGARALVVAGLSEALGEHRGVLQVRALEPHPHDRDEPRRVRDGRHSLPEPVAHGEAADREPEALDLLAVDAHVANLVPRDRREPGPEVPRRLGEREQRPRHELGGLQLVVEERVQRARAALRAGQAARLLRLVDDAKLGGAPRLGEASRRGVLVPERDARRHHELVGERVGVDVVPRPALDGVQLGSCHAPLA